MKNKYKIILIICVIIGICSILVGSIAYYRIVVEGNIKGSTGNAVFVLKDENSNVWNNKEINLGKVNPGDSGSFTVTMDASGSTVDMYATLEIEKTTLPTNLKFYTTSDHKSELHKYYSFLEKNGTSSETLAIYWYWNLYISDEEDSKFINIESVEAKVRVSAVQISEYAMMKNGNSTKSEFWSDTYKPYIRTINFGNDLSNLPSNCTEENLCFDVTSDGSKKKVYGYLIDSGLKDSNNPEQSLYNLYIVSEAPIFAPIDCSYLFAGLYNITSINFNDNFNTSKVTNMSYMFGSGYYRSIINNVIQNLDLSSFNTLNVTNMSCMFLGYQGLLKLNIDNFNTSKVTDMRGMFSYNSSLTNLDLSSFNTSNVIVFGNETITYGMFYSCSSLTSLDLCSFTTSNVTTMYGMFSDCSSLTSLDLSSFDTSNCSYMDYMFSGCSSLIKLNLNSFNKLSGGLISGFFEKSNLFYGCSFLKYLDISNCYFDDLNEILTVLKDCTNLITTINITNFNYGTTYNFDYLTSAKITINYTSNCQPGLDAYLAAHPDYNWVKGKLITAPTSN